MHQETFELNCSGTSLALDGTLVVVVETSLSTWLVCAEVPGLERRAMMKMSVDEAELLSQLHRWRDEAEKRLGGRPPDARHACISDRPSAVTLLRAISEGT